MQETRKFMSGSTELISPWTAEAAFIFPKLTEPSTITNSSLYGSGPSLSASPLIVIPGSGSTPAIPATGSITISKSPATGSTIVIDDGQSEEHDLNTFTLQARHDDSDTNFNRDDFVDWNNIPVYVRIQRGDNFGGDGSGHEKPGGFAQFFMQPLQIDSQGGASYSG
ncbi:MAG TPA: hypothetical protein DCM40_25830, partial [Maribacter sp.]|nr:hypothetical protein [Maribacter sp.]